jgi:EF-hand domain pair
MDKNGDGYLQKEEILQLLNERKTKKKIINEMGGTSPIEVWKDFLGDDKDGDGQIDLKEFIQMLEQREGDVNKTRMSLLAKNVLADHKKSSTIMWWETTHG